MAPGISYDDQGSLAAYFAITFLSLILFPVTLLAIRPATDSGSKRSRCQCSECTANERRLATLKRKRTLGLGTVLVLAGWAAFAYLAFVIAHAPKGEHVVYNPFEILGLGSASTEKQIKKHYKRLSLQFHPDKIKLAENQTREDADARFVELTKAYKALTDEGIRENLAKYGNPDGPQQREDKIAIPQWVVEGKNNIWVLGAYGLVLGGGIPWAVGRWWFSQRELTRDGTLNATAELIFKTLSDDIDFAALIALLASAFELRRLLGGAGVDKKKVKGAHKKALKKERAAKLEELENKLVQRAQEWGVEGVMSGRFTSGPNRHAAVLLWSHLLRIDVDPEFEKERLAVLRVLPPVLNSVRQVALSHNWLETSLLAISLQPHLVQALPPGVPPLQQLPKLDNKTAEALEAKGIEGHKWLEKFVAYHDDVEDADLTEANEVASKWPRLEVVDADFRVEGEKIVTPGAIVQFTYSVRYIYPGSAASKPPANGGQLPSDTTPNGSEAKETTAEKAVESATDKVKETVEEAKAKLKSSAANVVAEPNGYAHAPCWPQHRKPHWWVLIGDTKLNRVIVQPSRITDIPMPKADGSLAEPRELKLQFQAPPEPGTYTFVAYWRSDTYLGADITKHVVLKVEDASLLDDDDADDDISDPEEDSLAGQMAQMRGGSVKKSAVHGDEDETSEEESSDEDGPANRRPADSSDSDSD